MSAWLKRFGLHLAAAIGATGIFVGAAVVGAHQNQPSTPTAVTTSVPVGRPRVPILPRRAQTPGAAAATTPTATVRPERSLAGTIQAVRPDELVVLGVGGREWGVAPAPGALIRRNGKTTRLDALEPGDSVVILGQAQPGQAVNFLAHAIIARHT